MVVHEASSKLHNTYFSKIEMVSRGNNYAEDVIEQKLLPCNYLKFISEFFMLERCVFSV